MMGEFLLVCVCGGLGAVARFVLNTSIQRRWNRVFPLSTLVINITAAFFAGIAASAYFYQTVGYGARLFRCDRHHPVPDDRPRMVDRCDGTLRYPLMFARKTGR